MVGLREVKLQAARQHSVDRLRAKAPLYGGDPPGTLGPMRSSPITIVTLVALGTPACPRPPVGGPGGGAPPPPGQVGPVALEIFTQDRPAIAGKWFDYNPDGHTLTPKPQAWVVRDTDAATGEHRFIALRIVDIYESDAAESGLFTFGLATYDPTTQTWSDESEWVTPRNIKLTGQLCTDLFSRSELPCVDGEAWQLRLALFQYLSPLAGLAVAEPGVFVHDARARVARVDDVASLRELAGHVPDPRALAELEDAPRTTWDGTDWNFAALAPDLPEAGMAIGSRFATIGTRRDVYWLITSRFDLVRFTVEVSTGVSGEDALTFSYAHVPVDRDTWNAPDTMPEETSAVVALPAAGSGTWLTFDPLSASAPETLAVEAEHLVDTAWPHAPPKTTRFDLAVERAADGTVRLLVSQGAALLNATQLGLDENVPPVL